MTTIVDERDGINAPLDATPDPDTTWPERYALFSKNGEYFSFIVYKCRSVERGEWEVVRTYLRDKNGIHSDPRFMAACVADTVGDAFLALYNRPEGDRIAVPVSVARGMTIGDEVEFAPDGYHPTLGTAVVP
jgi:hypothetical protein